MACPSPYVDVWFSMKKQRLSPEDWIFCGFNTLADQGPSALKAEVLARRLGTTKGSFYWHFKDVADFHAAMMALWEQRAVTDIIAALEEIPSAPDRLRQLARLTEETPDGLDPTHQVEAAIRAWAGSVPLVRDTVSRVDARRMDYLRDLLIACDLPARHAKMIYATYVGLEGLAKAPDDPPDILLGLINLLLSHEAA